MSCADAKRFEEFKNKLRGGGGAGSSAANWSTSPSRVNLQLTQERWPEVRFAATRKHGLH